MESSSPGDHDEGVRWNRLEEQVKRNEAVDETGAEGWFSPIAAVSTTAVDACRIDEAGLALVKRSAADYARELSLGSEFSLIKLNHGMFERLERSRRLQKAAAREGRSIDPVDLDRQTGTTPCFLAGGFIEELTALFAGAAKLPGDWRIAMNTQSMPASRRINGIPRVGVKTVIDIAKELLPQTVALEDALIWKRGTIDGTIVPFYRALRAFSVLIVGPRSCRSFADFLQLSDAHHIEMHPKDARCERESVLARIERALAALRGKPSVCLFEVGSLSPWLILRLHGRWRNTRLIDMGTALEVSSVKALLERRWCCYYQGPVSRTVLEINPEWPLKPQAHEHPSTEAERWALWRSFQTGIDADVAEVAGVRQRRNYEPDRDFPWLDAPLPVAFIENKWVDLPRVGEFLSLAKAANHWTNFGPVCRALERVLEHVWELPRERAVVMCSSGTAALYALSGLHAFRLGRPLRWVGSGYGFNCTMQGPLTNAMTLVDCDEEGMLDLQAVMALDSESYDGVLLTNIFGLHRSASRYLGYCRERGKNLIIDNALGFGGIDRSAADAADEFVSFHHTKPWGVGEGGCIVVRREDAPIVRNLLNFGYSLPPWLGHFASNGKISDFACALILERLERRPVWMRFYDGQRDRILDCAREVNMRPLRQPLAQGVFTHLPLLAPRPIDKTRLVGAPFVMQKYYRPLQTPKLPQAWEIFGRIVNVPSHSGMAAIPTEQLAGAFRALVS